MKQIAQPFVPFVLAVSFFSHSTHAAAVVRHFEFGESDLNASGLPAQVGDVVVNAHNRLGEMFFPDDPTQVDLQPAAGTSPVYVEGRSGPGSLAIAFDGETNDEGSATQLTGFRFCAHCPDPDVGELFFTVSQGQFRSSFNRTVQAWVKADPAGLGREQVVVADGGGQWGGIGITADGNWAHISSFNGQLHLADTGVPVRFGEWTNLAQQTASTINYFFADGRMVDFNFGWSGGSRGPLTVGANFERVNPFTGTVEIPSNPFVGAVDDLKLMSTSIIVGGFSPENDLDFWEDFLFSGLTGDINQDTIVDAEDLNIWSQNLGFVNKVSRKSFFGAETEVVMGDASTLLLGDANQNGIIDLTDFSIIKHAAAAQGNVIIPEPGTVTFALLSLGMVAIRRR